MRWLIDEMLPPATADQLNERGHEALSVAAAGLAATDDAIVYAAAVDQDRVMVTESEKPCVALVFVPKLDYPRGGALASHLAAHLHGWAPDNPDPLSRSPLAVNVGRSTGLQRARTSFNGPVIERYCAADQTCAALDRSGQPSAGVRTVVIRSTG